MKDTDIQLRRISKRIENLGNTQGVTNGDSHDHLGGDGAQIAYSSLSGTPTIPDELADLAADTTHRVVTDAEKTTWNAKEPAITKKTAFNKDYSTTATDIKMNGTQSLGALDTLPKADHVHPSDTSRVIAPATTTDNKVPQWNGAKTLKDGLALSGADVTIITGTKGTTGTLAAWNADGDIVEHGVWAAWVPTTDTGNADLSGYDRARYTIIGKTCKIKFIADNRSMGGSAGTCLISLPVTAAYSTTMFMSYGYYTAADGLGYRYARAILGTNTLELYKNMTTGTWAATETGLYIRIEGDFEIA